jgi:hypothetical protein
MKTWINKKAMEIKTCLMAVQQLSQYRYGQHDVTFDQSIDALMSCIMSCDWPVCIKRDRRLACSYWSHTSLLVE